MQLGIRWEGGFCLCVCFIILDLTPRTPGELVKTLLGAAPKVSYSLGLEWSPGICIFNKFPDDNETAGLRPHSENCWPMARM